MKNKIILYSVVSLSSLYAMDHTEGYIQYIREPNNAQSECSVAQSILENHQTIEAALNNFLEIANLNLQKNKVLMGKLEAHDSSIVLTDAEYNALWLELMSGINNILNPSRSTKQRKI